MTIDINEWLAALMVLAVLIYSMCEAATWRRK